ncbi:hypothetical protein [uncultured Lacinutrix sp.]|uniref:hypothetical protein n=1 Tax=uncultured Lacinutrix sp. TaxID=574032 RepID=UPI002623D63A|nr:hypothetical protein [uncultured Lacinutrix sp.]
MLKNIISLCVLILLVSCKTVSIDNQMQSTTTQQIILGTIGIDKELLLNKSYTNTAIPEYKEPVKVSVSVKSFNKKTFKAFSNANTANLITVNYVDSLEIKPKFVSLYIQDKITVLKALNSKTNKTVKSYLTTKNEASIISYLSMALNQQAITNISQADECFLEKDGIKSYTLQLYKNGEKTNIIRFNDGVVFAYKTLNCCWKQNEKQQLEIVDLIDPINRCPNKTSMRASRAKKEINYFKL